MDCCASNNAKGMPRARTGKASYQLTTHHSRHGHLTSLHEKATPSCLPALLDATHPIQPTGSILSNTFTSKKHHMLSCAPTSLARTQDLPPMLPPTLVKYCIFQPFDCIEKKVGVPPREGTHNLDVNQPLFLMRCESNHCLIPRMNDSFVKQCRHPNAVQHLRARRSRGWEPHTL